MAHTEARCDPATTTGWITAVERGCQHDGPGLRTTLFLKGCPLRCRWCHNPETQRQEPELLYRSERCRHCGDCAAACPRSCHHIDADRHAIDRAACNACGACVTACTADALVVVGRRARVDELIALALRDRLFYGEDGGLTVSGGEPLAQPTFTRALLHAAGAAGLHRCLETCGHGRRADLLTLATLADLVLFDWKISDPRQHRRYTGVAPDLIRSNLRALTATDAHIRLRCLIVPGLNDHDDHLLQIAELAEGNPNIEAIEVLAHHPYGGSKYQRLGRAEPSPAPYGLDHDARARARRRLAARTSVPVL